MRRRSLLAAVAAAAFTPPRFAPVIPPAPLRVTGEFTVYFPELVDWKPASYRFEFPPPATGVGDLDILCLWVDDEIVYQKDQA